MLIHIHTVVENSDYNDPGFRAGSVKDDMTALTEFFVPWFYVIRIAANIRLASKQLESIVNLPEVFISLTFSPFFGGETAYIDNVFSGSGSEQVWTHQ
ncbi:hypothetical protein GCM10011357_36920 [Lacimicrobium alkaliphilum]|uniref:Uncharacterized protein n=1 Tax=Lacimicrobium alkaliphilum TaxID=1526571 RepID=A0ABQ1RUJ6_9ALTE|nr:hypothetical protein GCM10011357_36920 [Lacimicrobium alkaliphilum]